MSVHSGHQRTWLRELHSVTNVGCQACPWLCTAPCNQPVRVFCCNWCSRTQYDLLPSLPDEIYPTAGSPQLPSQRTTIERKFWRRTQIEKTPRGQCQVQTLSMFFGCRLRTFTSAICRGHVTGCRTQIARVRSSKAMKSDFTNTPFRTTKLANRWYSFLAFTSRRLALI
ncbi:hypothetical protein M404DRAFT_264702 [Pisolithus tinctorius Marx 270]|uniref:Uncharacterized protein n=1 Tax=Pisolithus tinctorius Marx 270 TaxID=870435 RepID=A0A0C3P7N4_PISTI|nr:hypothetical protein M404DRAFT_264702 [Pisolithus tinctorius Marx 270]